MGEMGEKRNERKNKIETKTGMNYMNNNWECRNTPPLGISKSDA